MSSLVYNCPHCGSTHRVEEALIGDRVDCRDCGQPFRAAMPIAHPVEGGANIDVPESHRISPGEGEIEDIIVEVHPSMSRQSPLLFLGLVVVALLGVVGLLLGTLFTGVLAVVPGMLLWIVGLILLALSLGYLGIWWIQSLMTTLTVSNLRTRLRHGIIARRTTEVRHEDVLTLKVDQGTLDSLLNVGKLSISSAGGSQLEIIAKGIPDPERIAAIIRDMQ